MTVFCHVSRIESTPFVSPIQVVPGCLQIRCGAVSCHAFFDDEGVTLFDGGFPGIGVSLVADALDQAGLAFSDVRAIIATHGHIDHTLNIAPLATRTGAPVHAPRDDAAHIAGTYPYRGIARICGLLEAVARRWFGYRVPSVDSWFEPGDILPFWGGFRVVGLPGHTVGYCGYYSERRKLLLASDLFSVLYGFPKPPPPWFNTDPASMRASILAADRMDLSGGVLINHGIAKQPGEIRQDLHRLANRIAGRKSA